MLPEHAIATPIRDEPVTVPKPIILDGTSTGADVDAERFGAWVCVSRPARLLRLMHGRDADTSQRRVGEDVIVEWRCWYRTRNRSWISVRLEFGPRANVILARIIAWKPLYAFCSILILRLPPHRHGRHLIVDHDDHAYSSS